MIDLIKRHISRVIFTHPVFGFISQYLYKTPTDKSETMPTMGVRMENNHTFSLTYNTLFANNIEEASNKGNYFILLHEFYHIALGHVYYKFDKYSKVNHSLFNIAADLVVNQLCFDTKNNVKEKGIPEFWCVLVKTGKQDQDGEDIVKSELVITRWIDLWEGLEKSINKFGAENIVEFSKGGPFYPQNFDLPENLTLEQYYALLQNKFPTMDVFIDGVGNVSFVLDEAHKHWGKEELDSLKRDITNSISRAIANKTIDWGNITGDFQEIIKSVYNTEVNWHQIVRMFAQSIIKTTKHNSRKTWNKKYGTDHPGKKKEKASNLMVWLDVSGSMPSEDLEYCVGSINNLCTMLGIEVSFGQFDTEIKSIEKKYNPNSKDTKIKGRGGTDPSCVMEHCRNGIRGLDGVIIFTDGGFGKIDQSRTPKTLWIFTKGTWNNDVTGYKTEFGKNKIFRV